LDLFWAATTIAAIAAADWLEGVMKLWRLKRFLLAVDMRWCWCGGVGCGTGGVEDFGQKLLFLTPMLGECLCDGLETGGVVGGVTVFLRDIDI